MVAIQSLNGETTTGLTLMTEPAPESTGAEASINMTNVLQEHVNHTAWVFETEIGPHQEPRDYHFDAEGFEAAMRHSKKLLKEAQDEGQEVSWPRLRPYGLNTDETYEVTLD